MSGLNIQWFPGHMTKAKREMQEKIKLVDFVIELRDARVPGASKNPMLDEILGDKPRLIILSKKDKADPKETKLWLEHLRTQTSYALAFDITKDTMLPQILEAQNELMSVKLERMKRRGMQPRAMRAMVVGIPNVGKSTFINRLAGKKIAKTGDRPGVTKALQWIKVGKSLELLDTPGVLWPKFEEERVGVLLAITGAIRDEVLPIEELSYRAMKYLLEVHPDLIEKRYGLQLEDDPYEMLLATAKKRGYLKSGNTIDEKRMYEGFLKEIRDNMLGAITWERVNDENPI